MHSYNDLTLILKYIDNKKVFEGHKKRLNKIYSELDSKKLNELGFVNKNEIYNKEREKYLSYNREYEQNARSQVISKENKRLYESLVKINMRENEIEKNVKCYSSQAPQKSLRKEKYTQLKEKQINKDNEDLEKRIANVYRPSIDYKKWEINYNKSIDYQKYSKKFELPCLDKKALKIMKREIDSKQFHRTDKGHKRILSMNALIDVNVNATLSRSTKSKDFLDGDKSDKNSLNQFLNSNYSTKGFSVKNKTKSEFILTNSATNLAANNTASVMSQTFQKSFPKIYISESTDRKKKINTSSVRNKDRSKEKEKSYEKKDNIEDKELKENKEIKPKEESSKNFENIMKNIKNDVEQYVNNMELEIKQEKIEEEKQDTIEKNIDMSQAYIEQKE